MNYDIKIHRDPVQNASQTVIHMSLRYTEQMGFQRIPSFQSGRKFTLLICIICSDCLGFFVEVWSSILVNRES